MPRPTARPKSAVSAALIRMRANLGMTQAELAARLKVALPTLGKWESYDPPTGDRLEQLALFAERNGDLESAQDFRLQLAVDKERVLPMFVPVYSEEESRYAFAVSMVLREERFAGLRPALKQVLDPALTALDFMMSELRRTLGALKDLSPGSAHLLEPLPEPKQKSVGKKGKNR